MPGCSEEKEGNKNMANGLLDLKIIHRQQGFRRTEIKNSKTDYLKKAAGDENRQTN